MSLSECDSGSLLAILERAAVADVLALGSTCKALRALTSDDLFWRGLAQRKWGHRVLELRATAEEGSWRAYAVKRMNLRTIKASPLQLGQERFPDPWQHIICCVLCSRTSGSAIIRDTINRFFEALPTPSAVLDADDAAVTDLIHPLGLQPVRLRAVRSVSEGFLGSDWEDPTAFYGCGRFVADSWRIFCRGDLSGAGVEDRNLRAYVAWAKRQARVEGGGGEGSEADPEGEGAAEEEEGTGSGEEQGRRRRRPPQAAEPSDGGARAARRARREESAAAAAAAPRRETRSRGAAPPGGGAAAPRRAAPAHAPAGGSRKRTRGGGGSGSGAVAAPDAVRGRDQSAGCGCTKWQKGSGAGGGAKGKGTAKGPEAEGRPSKQTAKRVSSGRVAAKSALAAK